MLTYAVDHCVGCTPADHKKVTAFEQMVRTLEPTAQRKYDTANAQGAAITEKINAMRGRAKDAALTEMRRRIFVPVEEALRSRNPRPAMAAIAQYVDAKAPAAPTATRPWHV